MGNILHHPREQTNALKQNWKINLMIKDGLLVKQILQENTKKFALENL